MISCNGYVSKLINSNLELMLLCCVLFCLFLVASCDNDGLPTAPVDVKQFSGYIQVNDTYDNGSHLFYWGFEAKHNPETAPLVLWLTGGPGCSSTLALLSENGPIKINDQVKMIPNDFSWNNESNILYVDNPVGTGFSWASSDEDYVTNEKEVAMQLSMFMQEFFQIHPKYSRSDFFIFGESYAGHYVPATANRIVMDNQKNPKFKINLKGIAIGNGWVDPKNQYPAYVEYAAQNGLINEAEKLAAEALLETCMGLLDVGLTSVAFVDCNIYLSTVMSAMELHLGRTVNPYDVKIPCDVPGLCYNFTLQVDFMNQAWVQKDLGVHPGLGAWQPCYGEPHSLLLGDWIHNLAVDLPAVLAADVRVLVYSGKLDFVCNYLGGYNWVSKMAWPGQQDWLNAPMQDWTVDGQKAGEFKKTNTQGGLTFLQVEGAGHMVPMDQPLNALVMMQNFLQNKPF